MGPRAAPPSPAGRVMVDDDHSGRYPSSPQSPRVACVHWVHGSSGSFLTRFERARTVVGRSPDCDITLEAAGVSRRHAAVFHEGPVCTLADTGSKNGIFVNGRAVT